MTGLQEVKNHRGAETRGDSVVLSSGSSITDSGINGLWPALQATDNICKGVAEWNPKDDPHAQVLVWTLLEHSGPQML